MNSEIASAAGQADVSGQTTMGAIDSTDPPTPGLKPPTEANTK